MESVNHVLIDLCQRSPEVEHLKAPPTKESARWPFVGGSFTTRAFRKGAYVARQAISGADADSDTGKEKPGAHCRQPVGRKKRGSGQPADMQ